MFFYYSKLRLFDWIFEFFILCVKWRTLTFSEMVGPLWGYNWSEVTWRCGCRRAVKGNVKVCEGWVGFDSICNIHMLKLTYIDTITMHANIEECYCCFSSFVFFPCFLPTFLTSSISLSVFFSSQHPLNFIHNGYDISIHQLVHAFERRLGAIFNIRSFNLE